MKVKSESEVAQSCPTLCNPMDCSLPGSSIHGILQARVLEWVAISFSRGSSQPRDQTRVSWIPGRRFNLWATDKCNNMDEPQTHNSAKCDAIPCTYSIYTKFRHRQNCAWITEVRIVVVSGDGVRLGVVWKEEWRTYLEMLHLNFGWWLPRYSRLLKLIKVSAFYCMSIVFQ